MRAPQKATCASCLEAGRVWDLCGVGTQTPQLVASQHQAHGGLLAFCLTAKQTAGCINSSAEYRPQEVILAQHEDVMPVNL